MKVQYGNVELVLSKDKVVYIPQEKALLIADVHLGKITHFRKAGIGIPSKAIAGDYRALNNVIEQYNPDQIILMGDLFHSNYNSDWTNFTELMEVYSDKHFILVKGNHDIMASTRYERSRLSLLDELTINQLILTHEPLDKVPDGYYNICGHIHPGVRIRGASRQSLRLPCYYFSSDIGILPAFGRFTGLATVKPKEGDTVVVITDNELIPFI